MGRKKLYSDEEREERVLQQKKAYYQRNKEKIAEKYRLWRLRKLGIIPEDEQIPTKPLRKVIEEWNKQLYQQMQTNLPQWLEMALNKQIELNIQFISQYEQEKPRI